MGPLLMMEDHREAYFLWQRMGLRGASCLHVDAHLDMAGFQAPLEADLASPEINCANFLLKAVQQGIVGQVVWVVPPHLLAGHKDILQWLYFELPTWLALSLDEFKSLQLVEGRVTGLLRGVPLVVCTSDCLPPTAGPWLLDLDVDYFIDDQDGVWQTPFQLQAQLQHLEIQAVTVAYSVRGGYTPVTRRYLGDLSQLLWSGQSQQASNWWASFHSLQSLSEAPPNLQAAALVSRAWGSGSDHQGEAWDLAAQLDPAYQVEPFDVAAMYWLRKKYARCALWLERVDGASADYLRGFIAMEQGRPSQAAQFWEGLRVAGGEQLDDHTRRHLASLVARAWKAAKKPEQARDALQAAVAGKGGDSANMAELYRELGRVQRQLGNHDQAIQCLRKAIKLAPDLVDNLEAQIDLAELYIEVEQLLRAQGEYRKLIQRDLPGNLRVRTERIPVKIALRTRLPRLCS